MDFINTLSGQLSLMLACTSSKSGLNSSLPIYYGNWAFQKENPGKYLTITNFIFFPSKESDDGHFILVKKAGEILLGKQHERFLNGCCPGSVCQCAKDNNALSKCLSNERWVIQGQVKNFSNWPRIKRNWTCLKTLAFYLSMAMVRDVVQFLVCNVLYIDIIRVKGT